MKKITAIILFTILILLSSCTDAPQLQNTQAPASVDLVTIYAPASTSSVPVILAARKMENVKLVLFSNQTQANVEFLRGDAQVMVTGLSVGFDLKKNGAPLLLVNSYVNGLSYLVTNGFEAKSFSDLRGRSVYVPFEGSPIEEAAAYLAGKEGISWKTDIAPIYSPFDASMALLKEGKLEAVILPEPMVSLVEGQPGVFVGPSLYALWNQYNPSEAGYPQVGTVINADFAAKNPAFVAQFNEALEAAIAETQRDPAASVEAVKDQFKIPAPKMAAALGRTHYQLLTAAEMQAAIKKYYEVIGKPLSDEFEGFYYLP